MPPNPRATTDDIRDALAILDFMQPIFLPNDGGLIRVYHDTMSSMRALLVRAETGQRDQDVRNGHIITGSYRDKVSESNSQASFSC